MVQATTTEMVVIPVEFSSIGRRKKLHSYALQPIATLFHTCMSKGANQNARFVVAGHIQNKVCSINLFYNYCDCAQIQIII